MYYYYYYYYYHYYYVVVVAAAGVVVVVIVVVISCCWAFLPGTSPAPTFIPTNRASNFTLQYFPYYV